MYFDNKKALYILENILSILINDIYSNNVKNIVVNNIKLYDISIKAIFNKLTFDNIKYVVDNILNVNNKIKNLRKYLRVSLINSFYQLNNKEYSIKHTYRIFKNSISMFYLCTKK